MFIFNKNLKTLVRMVATVVCGISIMTSVAFAVGTPQNSQDQTTHDRSSSYGIQEGIPSFEPNEAVVAEKCVALDLSDAECSDVKVQASSALRNCWAKNPGSNTCIYLWMLMNL